jgi:hypothetical protein
MKSSIERAMERLEFEVQVDPEYFASLSKEEQDLFVESLSQKERWTLFRMFKTNSDGKVEWEGVIRRNGL